MTPQAGELGRPVLVGHLLGQPGGAGEFEARFARIVAESTVEPDPRDVPVVLKNRDHVLEPRALGDPPAELRGARPGERGGGGAEQAADPGARQPLGVLPFQGV